MTDTKAEKLEEAKLSTVGAIFAMAAGAWLVGKASHIKIRGDANEIELLKNALMSSKRFQDELKKPGATAASVIQALGLKNASASEFQRKTGVPWPL